MFKSQSIQSTRKGTWHAVSAQEIGAINTGKPQLPHGQDGAVASSFAGPATQPLAQGAPEL